MRTVSVWRLFLRGTFIGVLLLALTAAAPAEGWAKEGGKKKRGGAKKTHVLKRHRGLPVASGARYAALVIEARTGRILLADRMDELRHPASLTKMMTLYMTFQAVEAGRLRLDQYLPVSFNAASQSPSKLGLRSGSRIAVHNAIMGLITESANDAAVVLAEALGGSETGFATLMNQQARALGMTRTRFQNPSGLPDPDQVTTARDMAVLGHALITHYPRFYPWFREDSFVYAGRRYDNHNHLMERYEGMDGIKTGYVRASGFNLVASAVRNGVRVVGVVFGGRSAVSRDNQMAQILDEGFQAASRGVRLTQAQTEAEGDSASGVTDTAYIALPSKVAAVFGPLRSGGGDALAPAAYASPAPAGSAGTTPGANWGIQVGAFDDPDKGRLALAGLARTMAPLVGQAEQILQKTSQGDGNAVYRARFMGIPQHTARSLCAYMVRKGQSCVVVAPERIVVE